MEIAMIVILVSVLAVAAYAMRGNPDDGYGYLKDERYDDDDDHYGHLTGSAGGV